MIKLFLCYRDEPLGNAWRHFFKEQPNIEIIDGDICQLPCDAIISPANSFGFMDGGLDRLLSERFGWNLEEHVQTAIRNRPMRELLIGEAILISTGDPAVPWLICAPTMRVPMRIRTSINAYLAMKAILLAAQSPNKGAPIKSIAVPGLGTGVGQLAPEIAASQMWQAYKEVILGDYNYPANFAAAQTMHVTLNRTVMLYD